MHQQPHRQKPPQGAGILAVEDGPSIRGFLRLFLEPHGFQAWVARGGRGGPGLPPCFMSAGLGAYRRVDLLNRGAPRVFPKAFTLNEMLRVLQSLVSGAPIDS